MQPNAKRSGGGREGSEIGSAVNVDKKIYSLLRWEKDSAEQVSPAVSQTHTKRVKVGHNNKSNIELITRWKDMKCS